MLNLTACLISGALVFSLLQAVSADEKTTPTPQRVLITYQVLEVPGDTGIPDSTASTASDFYKDALQNIKGSEATEISVQTTADQPAEARYSRILTFSVEDHGKPTRKFLELPTSLEATPHINPDNTITVLLKTEVTRAAPQPETDDQVPLTNGESWQTTQTFKSGEIRMFAPGDTFTSMRGLVGNSPEVVAENKKIVASQYKVFVPFVTVTVLPNGKAEAR